jgi:hypothetical protein
MHLSCIISFVLGLWAFLLLFKQVEKKGSVERFVARCSRVLLPTWGLFTADLRALDVYMYIRDFHDDGSTSGWRHATPRGRQGRATVTYTDRRLALSFVRHARMLIHRLPLDSPFVSDLDDTRTLMASSTYRMLLQLARSYPAAPNAERRQFLLAMRPHPEFEDANARPVPEFTVPSRVPRVVTGFHPLHEDTPRIQMERAVIRFSPGTTPATMHTGRQTATDVEPVAD